ncbi:MAG: Rieske 2Fe-2S domain-containing protein, partial [Bacteroidota bacterium]
AIDLSAQLDQVMNNGPWISFQAGLGTIAIDYLEPEGFVVIHMECPHNGCYNEFYATGNHYVCPCEGSTFSRKGCLLIGPADEALRTYDVIFSAEENTLLVVPGSARLACS